MRAVVVLISMGGVAIAQPAAPAPPPPPAPTTELRLQAGLGIARYRETGPGFSFDSDAEALAQIGVDGAIPIGRAMILGLSAIASGGGQVHMQASQGGQVFQENDFKQEIFEGAASLRWRLTPAFQGGFGYRFTRQRLHFLGVPNVGDALETVTVHALEAIAVWARTRPDRSARQVELVLGLNRGRAENDQIDGEDLTASGVSFALRAFHRWPSRFVLGGTLAARAQNGSEHQQAQFMGMTTDVVWPKNTTVMLLVTGGYAFD